MTATIIITVAYYNSTDNSLQKTLSSDALQSTATPSHAPNLQVFSPQNITYQTAIILLNATANNSTTKITYMLDTEKNKTLGLGSPTETWNGNENAEICLSDGVHKITFYAFNNESKLEDSKTVIFSVKHLTPTPKPPPTSAEAINYFASQDFTIEKVSNIAIDGYDDKGVPIIKYSIPCGITERSFLRSYL